MSKKRIQVINDIDGDGDDDDDENGEDLKRFIFLYVCLHHSCEKLVSERNSSAALLRKLKERRKTSDLGSQNIHFIETFCTPTTEYHF